MASFDLPFDRFFETRFFVGQFVMLLDQFVAQLHLDRIGLPGRAPRSYGPDDYFCHHLFSCFRCFRVHSRFFEVSDLDAISVIDFTIDHL